MNFKQDIAQVIDFKQKRTKKWREEKIREILDSHEFYKPFNDEVLGVVNEVLGTKFYAAKRTPYHPHHRNMQVQHYQGEDFGDWSWKKTIRPPSEIKDAFDVMRKAIQHELDEYRHRSSPECVKCGSSENPTVDHKTIPFIQIAQAYIEQFGLPERYHGGNGAGWLLAEPDMWIDFHWEMADYQILCRSCNSAKGASIK